MKVIMTYRNYHNMQRIEIFPEIFRIKDDKKPEDALRKMWEDYYNGAIIDNMNNDYDDPIDENGCWFKENMALITWKDGDTKEFYLIELVDYKEV